MTIINRLNCKIFSKFLNWQVRGKVTACRLLKIFCSLKCSWQSAVGFAVFWSDLQFNVGMLYSNNYSNCIFFVCIKKVEIRESDLPNLPNWPFYIYRRTVVVCSLQFAAQPGRQSLDYIL